jgi:hypothetical protein
MPCPPPGGASMCRVGPLAMRSGRGMRGVIVGNGLASFRSCPSPGDGFAGALGRVFSVVFESLLEWC